MRRALVLSLALIVSACASGYRGEEPLTATMARQVAPTEAVIVPPPGGAAIVGVIETRYNNGIEQQIVLSSEDPLEGENYINVRMFGPVGRQPGDQMLSFRRPSLGDMQREMRKVLPDVGMYVSSTYVQNFYGPFAYAFGRRGNTACLFGWQTIEAHRNQFGESKGGTGSVQVRVRLCRVGASEDSLLAFMYGYTLSAYFTALNWNPLGTPRPVNPDLGQNGAPMLPVPQGVNPYYTDGPLDTRLKRVLPQQTMAPARRSGVRRSAVVATQPVAVQPVVTQTLVPAATGPVITVPPPGATIVGAPGTQAGGNPAASPSGSGAGDLTQTIQSPPALPDASPTAPSARVSATPGAYGFGVTAPTGGTVQSTQAPSAPAAPQGAAVPSTGSSGVRVVGGSAPAAPAGADSGAPLQLPSAIAPQQ